MSDELGDGLTYVIVLKHVWDQLFTVNAIWNIGETGDMHALQYTEINL